jgi:hypothetical protein
MTRKNSSDGALPLGHADSNSSIGAKEMKEALTKGKKSEATRVLLSKINYETEPRRKSIVEFQTTSQSQLNLARIWIELNEWMIEWLIIFQFMIWSYFNFFFPFFTLLL